MLTDFFQGVYLGNYNSTFGQEGGEIITTHTPEDYNIDGVVFIEPTSASPYEGDYIAGELDTSKAIHVIHQVKLSQM